VSSWIPFEEPAGGPNFYLFAEHTNYDVNIDNNGDARPDIIYRWTFTTHYRSGATFLYATGPVTSLNDPNLNIYQTYDLTRIRNGNSVVLINNAKVAPSNVGAGSMPNYNADLFDAAVTTTGAGVRSWVGQSDDAFFLDLRVFDLLYGGNFSEAGDDTLTGFNVNTMVLSVPRGQLRGPNDSVIGIWNTASRPSMRVQHTDGTQTFSGNDVQVSRLGMPLVNEVVVPVGLKDYFNASKPKDDAQFLPAVNDPELPHLLNAVYPGVFPTVLDSNPNQAGIQRSDLVTVFLRGLPGLNRPVGGSASEMLRLNMDTPLCGTGGAPACSRLGVLAGGRPGVPERSPAVGRHDRHRAPRGDGGLVAEPRRRRGDPGRRGSTPTSRRSCRRSRSSRIHTAARTRARTDAGRGAADGSRRAPSSAHQNEEKTIR
jgi:hypothetical protein